MNNQRLTALRAAFDERRHQGLVSVCSAHPIVIEATLLRAAELRLPALIEATCNQVNQDGGYTGMTPDDFRRFVQDIADRAGVRDVQIIFGGDHLGPNPWKHLKPDQAMKKACDMIAAFADAGFEKLHLDASMGCAGEPDHLSDEVVAARAVEMARRAEAHAKSPPCYVIGTEIPTPGGAMEVLDHLAPTTPEAVGKTWDIHKNMFEARLPGVWGRVIGIVVQPGVEFGNDDIVTYDRAKAAKLKATLKHMPGLVYEAHSTDYQPAHALIELVDDGFCILKVGPALTFAMREALYGLDAIASILHPGRTALQETMEHIMRDDPSHWQAHYAGSDEAQRVLRHFSYSDRIRYYWPVSQARAAVDDLIKCLSGSALPETLISQFLPRFYERVVAGVLSAEPKAILLQSVRDVLDLYGNAARG